jgi:hypothetical protein
MTICPDPWRRLGAAGAALALSVALVHVPAALWAGNSTELHFPARTFLGLGALAATASLAIAVLGLWWLPTRARSVAAGVSGAVGILGWVYGLLLAQGMRALDDLGAPIDVAGWSGWWELPLVAGICAGLTWAIRRRPSAATRLLVLLNVALLGASAAAVSSAAGGPVTSAGDISAVFRFSRTANVLVVLLDGLQSDVAERAISRRPSLRSVFDGFVLYRDTLGVAPTTFLSVPAIHSGDVYGGQPHPGRYFTTSITRRSFVTRFAEAGYEATVVNPLQNLCPARTAACVTLPQVLGTSAQQLRRESLRLLDVSLFRVVPFFVKPWIYRDGRWFASARGTNEPLHIFEGNRVLDEIARGMTVGGDRPALKWVHSLATHTPYVLGADCTESGSNLGHAVTQARCALEAVGRLLTRLDRMGVYDNTAVLLVADHGMNPGIYPQAAPGSVDAWRHLAGSAHPLFLFKPPGRRGPVAISSAPVYLADVGATLCAATAACEVPLGFPAGEASPDRPRRFANYVWRNQFWRTREIPGLTMYEVRGPLDDPASWHTLD